MRYFNGAAGWLVAVVLASLSLVSSAFATEISYEPRVMVYPPEQPAQIGETVQVPAKIFFAEGWKTAKVTFASNNDLVKIDDVLIGTVERGQHYEYSFYIPLTISDEGLFDFKGSITIEALDGEKYANGQTTWTEQTSDFGAFAFEGEVFFGGNSELATKTAARRNLQKNNIEYKTLADKKERAGSGLLRGQIFSDEDEKKLRSLHRDETNRLLREVYDLPNVVKSTPISRAITPSLLAPQKGETVVLQVNFPTKADYTEFLPLDGAKITVLNNANNNEIVSGILNNGEYSFISPENNLSFTAKVTAQNRA